MHMILMYFWLLFHRLSHASRSNTSSNFITYNMTLLPCEHVQVAANDTAQSQHSKARSVSIFIRLTCMPSFLFLCSLFLQLNVVLMENACLYHQLYMFCVHSFGDSVYDILEQYLWIL